MERNNRKGNRPDRIETCRVEDENTSLLEFMFAHLGGYTKTKVKSMLKHRQFAVNGVPTTQFDAVLRRGDTVSINHDQSFKVFSHPRVRLVYEDEHILVINKGYGVLSMGTDRIKEGTAYSIMREYVKYSDPRAKVFIVHRLDRDTSGLMLIAKTMEAKDALQHNWNNMVLERKYVAVVEGVMENDEGTVKSYLAENSKFEVFSTDDPAKGQLAITRYKTLKRANGYSLVELQLDTGRKNQIRVHMSDLHHPIVGDRKYGAEHSPINRLALHAFTLRFVHPITKQQMSFETPIPQRFAAMVK